MSSIEIRGGCAECIKGVYSASWPPPKRVKMSEYGDALHCCDVCGTYWLFNVREAHPIMEDEARRLFPECFIHDA